MPATVKSCLPLLLRSNCSDASPRSLLAPQILPFLGVVHSPNARFARATAESDSETSDRPLEGTVAFRADRKPKDSPRTSSSGA